MIKQINKGIRIQMGFKKLLILGIILGGTAVVLGAFGAHGLENKISGENLQTFETGVRYQFYHAFLALIVAMIPSIPSKLKNLIFLGILVGVLLFSGSIYGLATNELTGFDFTKIALITPLGGLLLIGSWAVLLWGLFQAKPLAK